MADYYLQFSQVLPHLTDEESAWLGAQLQIVRVFGEQEFAANAVSTELNTKPDDWTGYRFLRGYDGEIFDTEDAGFCFELRDEEDAELGRHLWVYAEDNGELDPLAHLVQQFLRRFRPHECWSLAYASTCSKPRLDSFGGGAVFVTADEIKYDSTWDFIERETAAFAERCATVEASTKSP